MEPETEIATDKSEGNVSGGLLLGSLLSAGLLLLGYLIVSGDQSEFGSVMFLMIPFVAGFAVAAVVRSPYRVVACCLMGCLLMLAILLIMGREGIICCIMASPLIFFGLLIGGLIGYFVRGKYIDQLKSPEKTKIGLLILCPFLIAAADRVEQPFRAVQEREVFTTEMVIAAPPERLWDLIAEMEHLDGPRPFLLRVGLPVPQRCELEKPEVGSRRICYFHNGRIDQEVVEWQRPSRMKMRVVDSTLAGRNWLNFLDAEYEFVAEAGATRIIRRTTIGTRLYPRWYWRTFERWGVVSEHQYVLDDLRRRAL